MDYNAYQNPLNNRYASKEMSYIFSPRNRCSTWRQLWLWLAEAQRELGLDISREAIDQLRDHVLIQDHEFDIAAQEEKRRRHDVMAHVHTYGLAAPEAAGIIHWGATSCYVTDNADLIAMRDALDLLTPKLAKAIKNLSDFALQYRGLACLGYTHGQSAQPVTVGKRASAWIVDFLTDLENFEQKQAYLLTRFRGVKGTTGTQASFLKVFNGDSKKVKAAERYVTEHAGFKEAEVVTGQTYSRKIDVDVLHALSSFASSCAKFGGDLRHLAMLGEIYEPIEADQTGSSAMAYKRNPMRSERLCSLGRTLVNLSHDAESTYYTQWLERSLDDSAGRRLSIPQAFLLADACLALLNNLSSGLVVNNAIIKKRMLEELPFMVTENIMMAMTDKGFDRQKTHEIIRVLSKEAATVVTGEGKPNDLLQRVERHEYFKPILPELEELIDPATLTGRSSEIVEEVVEGKVKPALAKYKAAIENDQVDQLRV